MEKYVNDIELAFAVISGKVSNAINRNLTRSFKKVGVDITPEQWSILMCLWLKMDGMSQTQNALAEATFRDRPSVTRLIQNMEKQGLVTRETSDTDRRSNHIHLTEKGAACHGVVREATLSSLKTCFKGLSDDEIKTAFNLLGRVFNNLRDSEEAENI
ncbi:MAG: MarR family transcriptional regulator [Paludibacteraceae bacterium]|nr:MarR family transcriptional regulator [Paludibacteraceae bacterium]